MADPIDWEAVRARLRASARAIAEATEPSPERAARLLEERARALARVPEAEAAPRSAIEVVVFPVGAERYALETRFVLEVATRPPLTRVPGAPPRLAGVVPWRGETLAVFALVEGAPPSDPRSVVVLGRARPELGLLADGGGEVRAVDAAALAPPPESAGALPARGVTADAVLVLDGAALLGDRRFFVDST